MYRSTASTVIFAWPNQKTKIFVSFFWSVDFRHYEVVNYNPFHTKPHQGMYLNIDKFYTPDQYSNFSS